MTYGFLAGLLGSAFVLSFVGLTERAKVFFLRVITLVAIVAVIVKMTE